jgi:DNA-binding CsgD family transcriptional regulator
MRYASPDVNVADQATLASALNRVQFGILICSPGGELSFANTYARHVLDHRLGLLLGERGLETTTAEGTRALRDAIHRASHRTLAACVTLLLPRASAQHPLNVHVPVPQPHAPSPASATLFVFDPDHRVHSDASLLSRMYALTRAEANVAVMMMQGHSVEQVAEQLFISPNTARTHLKRILVKTDTGRQGEMLRVFLLSSSQINFE